VSEPTRLVTRLHSPDWLLGCNRFVGVRLICDSAPPLPPDPPQVNCRSRGSLVHRVRIVSATAVLDLIAQPVRALGRRRDAEPVDPDAQAARLLADRPRVVLVHVRQPRVRVHQCLRPH